MYRTRKALKAYNPSATMEKLRAKKNCPFCSLTEGRLIKSTEFNFVTRNIYEYQFWEFMKVTDHLLLLPRRHVESLNELTGKEKIDTIDLIAEYEAKGYNIYAREKGSVIKSVPHQHTHLIKTNNIRATFVFYLKNPYFLLRR